MEIEQVRRSQANDDFLNGLDYYFSFTHDFGALHEQYLQGLHLKLAVT